MPFPQNVQTLETLLSTEAELRAEAERMLESGLRRILDEYGEVHIMGSYSLHLMVWRDLDIHIVCREFDRRRFFDLGGRVAELLKPAKMHFRDEFVMQTPDLPRGLYWGVYLGDEREGAWKIDIWASDEAGFRAPSEFQERLRPALTEDVRVRILRIKSGVWQHPQYRKKFSSADVYRAVVEAGVEDVDGFFAYLKSLGRG
jgi:hypothetical protein